MGEAIEELRRAAGLTQEGLAARVGTEFNRIGELERGATDARFSTLVRVARWGTGFMGEMGEKPEFWGDEAQISGI